MVILSGVAILNFWLLESYKLSFERENPMKVLVIIPTYNEVENIPLISKEILSLDSNLNILVVDDNSPDGTADVVRKIGETENRMHLLFRENKEGLGKAYLAGFKWGLENGYDTIIEMDADFSYRPVDLKKMIDSLGEADFLIGSRYVPGGGTKDWGFMRKLVSKGGSLYSRFILGFPLKDWTGGFNAWKKNVLEGIDLDTVRSEGYCFQIELKYRAMKKGFKVKEVPILFEDRKYGQSKMSLRIFLEAFYKVWLLRLQK